MTFAASDFTVRDAPFADVRALVVAMHYSKGASNTASECHGLFAFGRLVGGALWLPPTRVCAESVAGGAWRTCLSLSRLVVAPWVPTNGASFLVGRSIRLIRAKRRWSHLVTFADESQGHTGTIYRATNWTYVGRTKPEARWVDTNGAQVSRLATKSRTRAEMAALGYRIDGHFAKHKFVMELPPLRGPAPIESLPLFRMLGVGDR